jgi:hypothetical protein
MGKQLYVAVSRSIQSARNEGGRQLMRPLRIDPKPALAARKKSASSNKSRLRPYRRDRNDALKRAHLESDPRRLDTRQDHWTQAFGAAARLNCYVAQIKQDCWRWHDAFPLHQTGARHSQSPVDAVMGGWPHHHAADSQELNSPNEGKSRSK